jgi:molecular chaperone HscB
MGGSASNPFSELGLPERFDLDAPAVESAYLARIAAIHPDLSDPAASDDFARRSAALHEAKAVLLDPERRAGALLALRGGPGPSDDRALPDGFLMEMMEIREAVEADRGDPGAVARWEAWAGERRAEHAERVAGLFDRADAAEGAAKAGALTEIRRELNAWRYIERLLEQLDPEYDPARADFGR